MLSECRAAHGWKKEKESQACTMPSAKSCRKTVQRSEATRRLRKGRVRATAQRSVLDLRCSTARAR